MRKALLSVSTVLILAAGLGACGGGAPRGGLRIPDEWHGPIEILRKYAGPDGRLTRAQLEQGLHRDFEAADINHNGVLDPDEMRAVNQQRWKEDQSAVSPLQDWNGDGVIDFNEFAATARALFNDVDRDGNGVLTPDELRIRPAAKDGLGESAKPATPDSPPSGGHRGRGSHGGPNQGG